MKRKTIIWIMVLVVLSFIFGFNIKASEARKNEAQFYRQLDKFANIANIVKNNYVKPVKDQRIFTGAIEGMLATLDPYSVYLPPKEAKQLNILTSGKFGGIGIEIGIKNNIITVVSPIEDSPAWKAGIKAGDKILEINGESTKGMTLWDVVKKLRGKPGTKVTIGILHPNTSNIIQIPLIRSIIHIDSVKYKILPGNIGYMRISVLLEDTAASVKSALEKFNSDKVKGLIIDLRNNPGGLLNSAVSISQLFLPSKKLIVYTKGRKPQYDNYFFSGNNQIWKGPIVILVNDGSASASEITTAALKDNLGNQCILVGTKTFGKGTVQDVIPIGKHGSELKLTIAYYYTPNGKKINHIGIEPDIIVKEPKNNIIGDIKNDVQLQKAYDEIQTMILAQKTPIGV
ncbi:MAG: S41 family peptidase [Candidatus Omnitrophica bacterium]|nr:S41 family peptidase [Candidatus Omnitrophota bacterium]